MRRLRSALLLLVVAAAAVLVGCSAEEPFQPRYVEPYTATGTVRDASGAGIGDVTLGFTRSYGVAMTDEEGRWTKSDLMGPVVVFPMKDGWYFKPETAELREHSNTAHFVGYPMKEEDAVDLSDVSAKDLVVDEVIHIASLRDFYGAFPSFPKASLRVPYVTGRVSWPREYEFVQFYNRVTGELEETLWNFESMSPSGDKIILNDRVYQWRRNWQTGKEGWYFVREIPEGHPRALKDDNTLLFLMRTGIWEYDVETGYNEKIRTVNVPEPKSIGVSPTGKYVYVGSRNGTTHVIDEEGSLFITNLPGDMRWSPTEDRLLWCHSYRLREWQPDKGKTYDFPVAAFDFSPDGTKIVVARVGPISGYDWESRLQQAMLSVVDLRDGSRKDLLPGFKPVWISSDTILYLGWDTHESLEHGVQIKRGIKALKLTTKEQQ